MAEIQCQNTQQGVGSFVCARPKVASRKRDEETPKEKSLKMEKN